MDNTLINLDSLEGRSLFEEVRVDAQGLLQPHLGGVFCKQKGSDTCGIQSCALLLDAAHCGKINPLESMKGNVAIEDKEKLPYTEQKLLESDKFKQQLSKTGYSTGNGLSLTEVNNILMGLGFQSIAFHASVSSAEEFRSKAIEVLKDVNSTCGIIVNYDMDTLGQNTGYGHHSPLGAYHQGTDRFLLYDCWPATKECWTTTENLFAAMNTIDKDTKSTRGYIIVKNFPDNFHEL